MSTSFPAATRLPLYFDSVFIHIFPNILKFKPKYIFQTCKEKSLEKKGNLDTNSSALKVDKHIYQVRNQY